MPIIRQFTTQQASRSVLMEVRQLLSDAFAGDFSEEDWKHTLGGWHVILLENHEILSHAAVVPRALNVDDIRFRGGYVEGVATASARQGEGRGNKVMAEASALVRAKFEMGALSTARHRFYERLGWERWRGPTLLRHGARTIREPAGEDGVMVLRFGRSQHVALDATLSFDRRRGQAHT